MIDRYILIGQSPVPEPDLMTWARWFETADRIVVQTPIPGGRVSTVFLGLDHSFGMGGQPVLFETMIFCDGSPDDGECWRTCTWLEAEERHAKVLKEVLGKRTAEER